MRIKHCILNADSTKTHSSIVLLFSDSAVWIWAPEKEIITASSGERGGENVSKIILKHRKHIPSFLVIIVMKEIDCLFFFSFHLIGRFRISFRV